jgi:SAM-dependent methyltransferase
MNDICVLCGSFEYEEVPTKLRYDKPGTVVTCLKCGLTRLIGAAQIADKLNEYYANQYAQDYHEGVKSDLDSLFNSFLPVQKDRLNKVKDYLNPTDKVLEIGSSAGYFLDTIRPYVAEVQGLELNKNEARYARESRNIPTTELPLENAGLPECYYDHIFLYQVLEHAADPVRFLINIQKHLLPGGKIHIELPNHMDPLVSFYNVEAYRNFYYQEPHLYYFTIESLRKVCQKVGDIVALYEFQQTSLINHLNWILLGRPQKSRWDCMQATISREIIQNAIPSSVVAEFDSMLNKFNNEYRSFFETNGFGDMIMCTIKLKKEDCK